MTFDENSLKYLEQDTALKNHLQSIHKSKSTKGSEEISRVVEGLLWKLQKEQQTPIQQLSTSTPAHNSYKYDIMISYSHSDKSICHAIYKRLEKDNFKVWIDKNEMCTETTDQMAKAIVESEFVLLCMSESYQESVYCRLEAHYALKQQRHMIPLIVAEKYKPKDWLDFIMGGKNYIDFVKLKFEPAYELIQKAIKEYRDSSSLQTNTKVKEQSCKIESSARPIDKTQTRKADITSTTSHV